MGNATVTNRHTGPLRVGATVLRPNVPTNVPNWNVHARSGAVKAWLDQGLLTVGEAPSPAASPKAGKPTEPTSVPSPVGLPGLPPVPPATVPGLPGLPSAPTTDDEQSPKSVAEVLAMADDGTPFMRFKSEASKILGDQTPAKKDEIVEALKAR